MTDSATDDDDSNISNFLLVPTTGDAPRDCISPESDVFSYFMLKAPSERLKYRQCTVDACNSYILVFLTLFLQGVVLFCVADKVVQKNYRWQAGILNTGSDWNLIQVKAAGCNSGQSLCTIEDGMYTCAPPSMQLIGRWGELDLDGDNVWTRKEVMEARENLRCKYAVDPVEVFQVFISLLQERSNIIWLHPEVQTGKAIPKMYFTYIMGDIAMCRYRSEDMCGNIFKHGFFDTPLREGSVPRIGNTSRSAIEYCLDLLSPRGLCERILPSTYSTWKIESVQECGKPEYSKFVYTHPNDPRSIKSLLTVDYEARQHQARAQTAWFLTFKWCIIFLWILLIISTLRDVAKSVTWILQLPVREQRDEEEAETHGEQAARHRMKRQASGLRHPSEVNHLNWSHRTALFVVFFLRICVLFVLLYVGLAYLGRQTDYINLLLDCTALVLIVEIGEIVYTRVLRQDVRTEAEERQPVEIVKYGLRSLTSSPDVMDVIWLGIVILLAVLYIAFYTAFVVHPLYEALECTCLGEGEKCREAHTFSKAFWDNYWGVDVPSAIQSINRTKAQFDSLNDDFAHEFTPFLLKHRHPQHHLG